MKYRVELHIKSEQDQWYREFEMDEAQTLSLGRKPSDIEVPQDSLSRKHCLISVKESALLVRDNNSKNGLFKTDALVKELLLLPGEFVRLGECELTLRSLVPVADVLEEASLEAETKSVLKVGHKEPPAVSNALFISNHEEQRGSEKTDSKEPSQVVEMDVKDSNECHNNEESKSYVIESFQKQKSTSEKTKTGYKIRDKYEKKTSEVKSDREISAIRTQDTKLSVQQEQSESEVLEKLPEFQASTQNYQTQQIHASQKIAVGQSLVSSSVAPTHVTQASRRVQFSVVKDASEAVPFYFNLELMGLNPLSYFRLYPLMLFKPHTFFKNVDFNGSYELSFFLIVFSTIISSSILFIGNESKLLFWPIFMLLSPFTMSNLFFRMKTVLGLQCKQHHITRIFSYWIFFLTPFSIVARFETKWVLVPIIVSFIWLAYGFEQNLRVKMSSVFPLLFGIGMSLFALTYFLIP